MKNMTRRRNEWLPLSTQQLRLRNLNRIEGINIQIFNNDADDDVDDDNIFEENKCEIFIYYTLHKTKDDLAFYKSEKISIQLRKKWAEIQPDEELLKSNLNCVCIKVWAHIGNNNNNDNDINETTLANSDYNTTKSNNKETDCLLLQQQQRQEPISALSKQLTNGCLSPNNLTRPPDKLLFTWAVYFSGLIPINSTTNIKFENNTLIFQINGYLFTSSEHIVANSLREQVTLGYKGFLKTVAPKYSTSLPPQDAYCINSPPVSRSASPEHNLDADLMRMSKARYDILYCPIKETYKSYNLDHLLRLQEALRLRLQNKNECHNIAEHVKYLSIHCITTEQLQQNKARSSSLTLYNTTHHHYHQQYHSIGSTLSNLLAEQQQIQPNTLYRIQELQKKLETIRCRQRLLESERSNYTKRITTLRHRLDNVTKSRVLLSELLESKKTEMAEECLELEKNKIEQIKRIDIKFELYVNIEKRMSSLCLELASIFPIKRNNDGQFTICDVPLPKIDAYLNDIKCESNVENITPMALSASLGYIAHLVQMISVILNRPLRNTIITEGSRSRIIDKVKDIPITAREFPLFTRSIIPSKHLKYGIYLLNQNIAQLVYDKTNDECDFRNTIENILLLFDTFTLIERSHCIDIRNNRRFNHRLHIAGNDDDNDDDYISNTTTPTHLINNGDLSKSHSSSFDMNHMPMMLPTINTAMPTLLQIPIAHHPTRVINEREGQQRVSRSVGSYSDNDDDYHDFNQHPHHHQIYSNSESNLTFRKDTQHV